MSVRPLSGVPRPANRLSQVLQVGWRAGLAAKAVHTGANDASDAAGADGASNAAALKPPSDGSEAGEMDYANEKLRRLRDVYRELWTLIKEVTKRSRGAFGDDKAYQDLKNDLKGALKSFEKPGFVQRLDDEISYLREKLDVSYKEYVELQELLKISKDALYVAEIDAERFQETAKEQYTQATNEVSRLQYEVSSLKSKAKAAEAQVDANTVSLRQELIASQLGHLRAVLPYAELQDQNATIEILDKIEEAMEDGVVDSSEFENVSDEAEEFFDAVDLLEQDVENISTEDYKSRMNASLELGGGMTILLNTLKSAVRSKKTAIVSLLFLASLTLQREVLTSSEGDPYKPGPLEGFIGIGSKLVMTPFPASSTSSAHQRRPLRD